MKALTTLAVALSIACCVAVAAERSSDFEYVAERFAINDEKELVTLTGMLIEMGKSSQLVAETAFYHISTSPSPRVVEINGLQVKSGERVVASAESAAYYPELRLFTTKAYQLNPAPTPAPVSRNRGTRPGQRKAEADAVGLMSLPTYTCRGGQLYDNEEPMGTSSTCFNIYGGGSHSLSCTEGGNMVRVIVSDQQCPVE